jgi:hypothetical protein
LHKWLGASRDQSMRRHPPMNYDAHDNHCQNLNGEGDKQDHYRFACRGVGNALRRRVSSCQRVKKIDANSEEKGPNERYEHHGKNGPTQSSTCVRSLHRFSTSISCRGPSIWLIPARFVKHSSRRVSSPTFVAHFLITRHCPRRKAAQARRFLQVKSDFLASPQAEFKSEHDGRDSQP